LADSPRETPPVRDRIKELQGEITELERRIERQVANLEAEDATPSLRRRVGPGSQRKRPLKNGGSTRTPSPPHRPTSRRLS